MKVIQVYKPLQDSNTELEKLELVEYITKTEDDFKNPGTITTSVHKRIPYWCVKSEMLKPNETYQEWLKRKKEAIEYAKEHSTSIKDVEGIYFYDIQAIGLIVDGWDENNEIKISKDKFGMMVRYDYIYRDNLKK
jgi:hypothetical protein